MPITVVEALVEALPHVQKWAGRTVVIKYGGSAMGSPELAEAVTQDIVLLHSVDVRVVLVHGGGAAVSEMGRKLGLEPRFVDGLRITDHETMRVAQMVHVGGISRDIVAAIGRKGGRAIGLSGHDGGGWLKAAARKHRSREDGREVDLGRVGDIVSVDKRILRGLVESRVIPVIAPVAVDEGHDSLNVNADSVATAVAVAMKADKVIFLTDVDGIRGPQGQIQPVIDSATLRRWVADGVVSGGMIPKAEACLDALRGGVGAVTVADGRVPHAVLIELLTDDGVGTMITP